MWQLLPVAASALMGINESEQKRQQQDANNKAQAEVTRYSPWTGIKGQIDTSANASPLAAGFGGAMNGLAISQAMGGMMGGGAQAPKAAGNMGYFDEIQGMQNEPAPTLFGGGKPTGNMGYLNSALTRGRSV